MNNLLETLRERSSAHRNHSLDLRGIDDRHDARNNWHIDIRNPAVLHKTVKLCVVKKQLGKRHFCSGIYLFLQVADLFNLIGRFRMTFRVAGT